MYRIRLAGLLLLAAPLMGIAQFEVAPGKMISTRSSDFQFERETVIWSEEFENGIPSDWVNSGEPSPAVWEYRGPATDPNIDIGTRGSCLPEEVAGGEPIDSPSRENGFVIFDSNYWDDPIGPCGNFGSGEAAAPHTASLTSPSLDLSDHDFVGVVFNQFAKNFQFTTSLQVSVNDGPFEEVFLNVLGGNAETPRDMEVRKNISSIAGGQADVRIRFHFEGTYYYWMLDDIRVVELDPNDLYIDNATYGDFDPDNPDHPTGFEFMEYSIYPQSMVGLLKFSALIENRGGSDQTNCTLEVEVERLGDNQIVHTAQSESLDIPAEDSELMRASDFQPGSDLSVYEVRFAASQDEMENSPDDNQTSKSFQITAQTYARDKRALESIYLPAPEFSSSEYELGNIFLITESGQELHSVSVGLSAGTLTESNVYASIYSFDIGDIIVPNLIATTQNFQVSGEDLNAAGQEIMLTLPFDSPIPLQEGQSYYAAVGAPGGSDQILTGFSGLSDQFTSWIHFVQEDQWFFMADVPMVRMNFGEYVGQEELDHESGFSVYPNPADDHIFVNFPDAGSWFIFDSQGRSVISGELDPYISIRRPIDVSALNPGAYIIHWSNNENSIRKSFIVK